MGKKKILHVVHCVDTEGPLEENVEATFQRIADNFDIHLEPSLQNLERLQNQSIKLKGKEKDVAEFISPKRLAYLNNWSDIERMVTGITSPEFRRKFSSPDASPYTYSWFIIDVVGYHNNPRRKAMGYNVVWEQYQKILKNNLFNDVFGWHFHSVAPSREALEYSTTWSSNDFHEQSLVRRLLKHKVFPSLFRAGGVIERNDISHWLERTIPFDFSNQNKKENHFAPGAQSDWRNAPTHWGSYHPCFYDYRKKGNMRRSIFRCIDISSASSQLNEDDVKQAFIEASSNEVAVLSFTNHDRRDIAPDVEYVFDLIQETSKMYPEVNWKFSNALEAARSYKSLSINEIKLSVSLTGNDFHITSNKPTFCGDVFLCIEEYGGIFYRDNATIESEKNWVYSLVRKSKTKRIGVAAVSKDGSTHCIVYDLKS
jgi:hypothetical protein